MKCTSTAGAPGTASAISSRAGTLEVVRAGVLTTVQDQGRHGYRQLGVATCGALDTLALEIGNRLVGNAPDAAGLEITLGRAVFRFLNGTRIALTGAECRADLDGVALPAWWSAPVAAGQTLTLRAPQHGMRAYLAVAGGLDVPVLLGSRATDLGAGFGGLQGRALVNGDCLASGAVGVVATPASRAGGQPSAPIFGVKAPEWTTALAAPTNQPKPRRADARQVTGVTAADRTADVPDTPARVPVTSDSPPLLIRVLRGPEFSTFSAASQAALWTQPWRLTADSNRMGFRLDGAQLTRDEPAELLSHAVLPGTIQVPPSGAPIVLMSDAQSTGGYPKIGVVIQADLWRLAQAPLGGKIGFIECSTAEARAALRRLQRYARQISLALNQRDELLRRSPWKSI